MDATTMKDAVVSGLTTAANDTTGTMLAIVPVALGVVAVGWGIRKAIRFFKASAN